MDEEKQEAIQQRWKFKLGIEDFDMPESLKKKHPDDIKDEDLAECDLPGCTLATIRLYIDKTSPFSNEAYNKNVFLDRCIEDLYKECEAKKLKKHGDIEKMSKISVEDSQCKSYWAWPGMGLPMKVFSHETQ